MDVFAGLGSELIEWRPRLDETLRLVAAALLSSCIGLEREWRERAAGLRTHILIGLAAALFTIVAIALAARLQRQGAGFGVDPVRAIEAVTAGVAFVAAGAIIRAGGQVQNLTTGAGLWATGAIGLACGAGYVGLAATATLIALVVLAVVGWLESRL